MLLREAAAAAMRLSAFLIDAFIAAAFFAVSDFFFIVVLGFSVIPSDGIMVYLGSVFAASGEEGNAFD